MTDDKRDAATVREMMQSASALMLARWILKNLDWSGGNNDDNGEFLKAILEEHARQVRAAQSASTPISPEAISIAESFVEAEAEDRNDIKDARVSLVMRAVARLGALPSSNAPRHLARVMAASLWRQFRDGRTGLAADEERVHFEEIIAAFIEGYAAQSASGDSGADASGLMHDPVHKDGPSRPVKAIRRSDGGRDDG